MYQLNVLSIIFNSNYLITFGYPMCRTEFWVPLDITKTGSQVTIQFPTINFQTGQVATVDNYE